MLLYDDHKQDFEQFNQQIALELTFLYFWSICTTVNRATELAAKDF